MSFSFPTLSTAKRALGFSTDEAPVAPRPAAPPSTHVRASFGDLFQPANNDIATWNRDVQKKIKENINDNTPRWTAEEVQGGRLGPADVALRANILATGGDVHNGGRTLAQAGDAFMKAGKYDEARQCFEKMKQPPFAGHESNTARGLDPVIEKGGSTTVIGTGGAIGNKDKFKTTFGGEADTKLAQLGQLQDMEKVMGRKIDPHNMTDVKAYLQKVSDKNPGAQGTAAVRNEYDRYLKNFYQHPGSVSWSEGTPINDRPAKFNELLANQPTDATGKKLVDCEGYMYMTKNLLGGIKTADGKSNRFEVYCAGGSLVDGKPGSHVVSGVYDKTTKQGFVVNNDSTKDLSQHPLMVANGSSEKAFAAVMRAYVQSGFVGKNASDAYDPKFTKLD